MGLGVFTKGNEGNEGLTLHLRPIPVEGELRGEGKAHCEMGPCFFRRLSLGCLRYLLFRETVRFDARATKARSTTANGQCARSQAIEGRGSSDPFV
jgi:hypothetical protein